MWLETGREGARVEETKWQGNDRAPGLSPWAVTWPALRAGPMPRAMLGHGCSKWGARYKADQVRPAGRGTNGYRGLEVTAEV